MNHNHEKCKLMARVLMVLSFVALVLAMVVSLFQVELWLAGTQWILVSILLALYALTSEREVFCAEDCCVGKGSKE